MECKIIILLYAVVHHSHCEMPDFKGEFMMPDFDVYPTADFEEVTNEFETDGQFVPFNPFGNLGAPGDTSAVLHNEPQSIEAKLGSDVTLPCHVTNAGFNTVSWSFLQTNKKITDGDQMLANKRHYRLDVRVSGESGEWNLVVNDVRHDDSGQYVCMLQTVPPQMKNVYLVLKAPPRIEKSSLMEIYKVMEGEALDITCKAVGSPTPVVQWYSYQPDPNTFKEKKHLFSNDSSLHINSLRKSDAGIYRCEATNNQGSDFYEIMIEAKYTPKPATSLKEIHVKYGMAAKLDCTYYSSPIAQLEWKKSDEKLKRTWKYNIETYKDEKLQGSELTIRSTDQSDSGEYKCIAINEIGQHETIFTVLVVDTTTATTNSTSTSSTTTATLSSIETTAESRPISTTLKSKNRTPGEIMKSTTEEISIVSSPRLDESHSGARSNYSVKVVVSLLTMLILIFFKIS